MRRSSAKLTAFGLGAMLLASACGGGAAPAASAPGSSAAASAAASAKPAASGAASASAKPAASGAASAAASAKPAGSAAAGAVKLANGKVVIGVINDMTMVYADLGGKNSVVAAQMAVDDWKAKNGDNALGGPISVIGADHQNKPDVATQKASEFYDREGVGMITDVPTSSTALAIADVARQKKKLFLNSTAASSELTEGKDYPNGTGGGVCNPYTYHWVYDTYMLAFGTAPYVIQQGGKDWYIIYPNYAYGQDMNRSFTKAIQSAGGKVVASDPSPFPNQSGDFSNLLLKAPTLKPQVLGAMQAGGDLVNVIKQYNEFKLKDQKIQLAIGLLFDTDIKAVGPDAIAGTYYTTPWIWSWDDASKAWADKFKAKTGTLPTFSHGGVYSATYQYLDAVKRAGTDDADAVIKALDGYKFSDMFIHNGTVRHKDHLVVHDVLTAQVKPQTQVTTPGDYSKIVNTVPADKAFRPESESTCTMYS